MDFQGRFEQAPFDQLTDDQQQRLIKAASLTWYKPGEKLIRAGSDPESLMVVQKGVIEERDAKDIKKIYAHYAEDDLFDVRALLNNQAKHEYICLEEALIQEIPAQLFRDTCDQNPDFLAALNADLSEKYEQISSNDRPGMADFLLRRIEESHCRSAKILKPEQSFSEAALILDNEHLDAVLVELEAGYGMVTRTDLLNAIAIQQLPLTTATSDIAIFPLITINTGEYLFDALLKMTSKKIERLVVMEDDKLIGLLDLNRILALASSHSHLLAVRIARATSINELVELSPEIESQARSLFANGVRTGSVMNLVSTLNDQLLARLFELHFPKSIQENICLMSLGSEGRGEQVLKTDQDNALIIADGFDKPPQELLNGFTQLLIQCGWPPCDGNVMVSNPHWVLTLSEWKQRAARWIDRTTPENMMEMAMMVDARAVAGRKGLLRAFEIELAQKLGGREAFLAAFVSPALQFDSQLTFFGRLKEGKDQKMDIKKAGIFPLVHGIRTLALEQRVRALSTTERLETLKARNKIDLERVSKLEEAFLVLNRLRLEQQIAGVCNGNELDLSALDYRRRDMLRHCLHTAKKFRQHLRHHFHIDG
ncbi:cyclic nucleotide-binding protein [Endozoicomonas sp. OPT23]|uniref:DUF294 nucleotidyltransferase-like domain-containing protein n=1 Tax=Endozoicomonas sp. OPT23 TaxID=2072845 RepID=UPI00129B2062|nr:DUF294 nucleotidyltransferase-like domain-containing protein [Endozoicomonas sp. OPT23]MRI34517.1 cyclic nucleotide-binding protein [Endozoicomonas sp. OPT23]